MNQILAITNKTEKRRNNSTVDLKKIIMFFCVAIIVFGVILIINGIVGLNKNKSNNQVPSAMITPNLGDYPTQPPMEQGDIEAPKIDIFTSGGETIKIIATDDEEIDYIEVFCNDEMVDFITANEGSTSIETTLEIQPGTNVIKVTAVDKAENSTEKTQEFLGKIRPTVELGRLEDGVKIVAECEEGLNKLIYKINGEWMLEIPFESYPNATKEDWAASGVIVDYSNDGKIIRVEYVEKRLQPGTNKFEVYAYSTSNLPGEMTSYTEN